MRRPAGRSGHHPPRAPGLPHRPAWRLHAPHQGRCCQRNPRHLRPVLENQTYNLHNVNPGFGPGTHQLSIRVGGFAETVGAFNRNAWANSPKYAHHSRLLRYCGGSDVRCRLAAGWCRGPGGIHPAMEQRAGRGADQPPQNAQASDVRQSQLGSVPQTNPPGGPIHANCARTTQPGQDHRTVSPFPWTGAPTESHRSARTEFRSAQRDHPEEDARSSASVALAGSAFQRTLTGRRIREGMPHPPNTQNPALLRALKSILRY